MHWASNVKEAVKLATERSFDAIMCDSSLSDTTWQDLLLTLERFKKSPRVVVTSSAPDRELWAEALNLGAYDVLSKPFCTQEVLWVFGSIRGQILAKERGIHEQGKGAKEK